jgi:DtxR family Mn-dependent transcriptional regulator
MGVPWDEVHEEAEAFEMSVTPRLEARMLEMIGEVQTCPHGHPIGNFPREQGVPLTSVASGSRVRILRFENEDHDLLRMFRSAGIEPREHYVVSADDGVTAEPEDKIRLTGDAGLQATLPLYAARTISVVVESSGEGDPIEVDQESLATAYLLGESHWSR